MPRCTLHGDMPAPPCYHHAGVPGSMQTVILGEDGASWESRLCMGHKVLPVLEGPTESSAKGLDTSSRELLSGAQEKDLCLGFLQGLRYFAPGKWCHVFPATDKVKPLIWLKV